MRSTWSLEGALALAAAALLEAAWLTLAYVAIQWLTGSPGLHLGIAAFAAAAATGTLLSRAARLWPRSRYLALMLTAIVAAAVAGTFVPSLVRPEELPSHLALVPHPGGWLLGLAVLRGAAHAEYGDEAENAEFVLRAGVLGLILFWVTASASRLTGYVEYTAPAFVATLAFGAAGLLALGMARLTELEVESVDRAARRRWVGLLLGISTGVVLLALPIAAVLGVPVAQSVEALAGPVAPLLGAVVGILAIPFSWLAELVTALVRALFTPLTPLTPAPSTAPDPSPAGGPGDPAAAGTLDLSGLGLLVLILVVAGALIAIASYLRQPGTMRRRAPVDEARVPEPIRIGLPALKGRLRLPRLRKVAPRSASEAYRGALAALRTTEARRDAGETPREHAARLGSMPFTSRAVRRDVASLAADYQLDVFAGRELSRREEARALARWRRIVRATRRRSSRKEPDTPA